MAPFDPRRQPPHPFWAFVADMDRDGFGETQWGPPRQDPATGSSSTATNNNEKRDADKSKSKQPTVEDEGMTDAAEKPSEKATSAEKKDRNEATVSDEEAFWAANGPCGRRGRHCGGPPGGWRARRGWPGHGPHPHPHPHPHGPGGPWGASFPFFGPGSHFDPFEGPPAPPGPPSPPSPPSPPGAPRTPPLGGFLPPPHDRHRHWEARHGARGPHHHHRRGPRSRSPFNLAKFLQDLGSRLGIDLTAAASNFGLDLSRAANPNGDSDYDFTAPYDLFTLPDSFLIHISLPGARREDIAVDFEPESNTLRVAGVIYRPGIDERINSALSHAGRKGEVGVFETKVNLSSSSTTTSDNSNNEKQSYDPIVDVDAITAKLRDGIMVIRIPRLVPEPKPQGKKSVRIESQTPSPVRSDSITNSDNEKATPLAVREKDPNAKFYEADTTTTTAAAAASPGTERGDNDEEMYDEKAAAAAAKEREQEEEREHEDPPEVLPKFTPHHHHHDEGDDSGDDEDDDEEEGEYVKINVD